MDTLADVESYTAQSRFAAYAQAICEQYPTLGPFHLEEVAHQQVETDTAGVDHEDLHWKVKVFTHQRYSPDVAMERPLSEQLVTVYAPPGYLLARVLVQGPRPRQVRLTFKPPA